MNLLVLGASGGCGRWVVRLARERGHAVTALVRPATEPAAPDGVRVVRGEALEPGVLEQALDGVDAVISCVGLKRTNPRNPWSRLVSPPDLLSRLSELLIAAAGQRGVRRFVLISAGGVGDSAARTHWFLRAMFAASKIGVAYRDLERMESVFAATDLDWLAVRPVTLTDGDPTGSGRPVDRYTMNATITRGDVARFLLDAVAEPTPFGAHTVMIAG